MKQRLLFLTLILIFTSCVTTDFIVDYREGGMDGTEEHTGFTVMTFNLHYYQPALKIWDRRKGMIETVLQEHNPDIITFQEIFTPSHTLPEDTTQLDWLTEILPEYTPVAAYETNETYLSPVVVFFKTGLFELIEQKMLFFTETPHIKPGGRAGDFPEYLCIRLRLRDKRNETLFYLYAVHLPFLDTPGQDLALRLIENTIQNHESPGEPVILLGDFNMFSDSDLLERIHNIPLTNTMPGTEPGSYHFYVGLTLFPRVDHIFVSRDFAVEQSIVSRYNKKGHYPSDHFPVISILRWK